MEEDKVIDYEVVEENKKGNDVGNINDDIKDTNIKNTENSVTEKIFYPRSKKFKNTKEIEEYIINYYYKKYYIEDDLPIDIVKEIIGYKIMNFEKSATEPNAKDILGNKETNGSLLWFNELINKEKEIKKELTELLEATDKEITVDQRRAIENNFLLIDEIIKQAKEGYKEAKNVYKIIKRDKLRKKKVQNLFTGIIKNNESKKKGE